MATPFTLQALRTELDTDPTGRGYKDAGVFRGLYDIASRINEKIFTVDKTSLDKDRVASAILYTWYDSFTGGSTGNRWIDWRFSGEGAVAVTADLKLQLTGRALCVNGAPGTGSDNSSFWQASIRSAAAPAMRALIEVPGSRAEVLFGEGRVITPGEISQAINLP